MGWSKLHDNIVDSSIWEEDLATRVLWVSILAIKDIDGFIVHTVGSLARRANISKEQCKDSLEILCGPDPESKSKEYDGARLIKTDDGWFVVNHNKYKANSKEMSAERSRKYRAKKASLTVTSRHDTVTIPSRERDAPSRTVTHRHAASRIDPDPDTEEISSPTDSLLSANADAPPLVQDKLTNKNNPSLSSNCTSLLVTNKDKKRKTKKKEYSAEFDHFWGRLLDLNRGYNNRLTTGKWESFKAWKEAKEIPDFPGEEGILAALERQLLSKDWKKNNGDFVPLFSTWLRAGRWTAVLPKTLKQRIQEGEFDD